MRFSSFARARRFGARSIGGKIAVWAAGGAAAILLTALLLLVPLLAELLATRGSLTVPIAERQIVESLNTKPPVVEVKFAHFDNCGLLPTAWRLRNSQVGPLVQNLYITIPALRNNIGALLSIVGIGLLLSIFAAAAIYWLDISIHRNASIAACRLRRQIHAQSHQLGASDLFVRRKLSSIDLFTKDTESLRQALGLWWRSFPHAACFAAFMLILAMMVNFWLAISTVLLVIVATRFFNILRRRINQKSTSLLSRAELSLAHLTEHLLQHRLLTNWRNETRTDNAAFDSQLQRFERAMFSHRATVSVVRPIVLLIILLGAWLILLLAGFNVVRENQRLSLADVALLGSTLVAFVYPLICFEKLAAHLPEAEGAAARIFNFLDRKPTIGQLPGATPLEPISHTLAFDHVTLADSQGRPLLAGVSVNIPAKQRVAIFSSGDATPLAVAGVLGRFCDPAAGQLSIDGRDARGARVDSVRQQVMLLLSGNLVASGSVLQNLTGDETTFSADEVLDALRAVRASDFAQSLPEGLSTLVGPDGISLSTGEAYQIGLARAALRNPSVIVIEEPEESLDQKTAEHLADAIENVSAGKTLIVLARRLPTLRAAQRVLLFHEGRLVADGTHQELLVRSELYRHLNYVRFNEFRGTLR
jgi:ATP-binding cassette, subfamily B, bacterial